MHRKCILEGHFISKEAIYILIFLLHWKQLKHKDHVLKSHCIVEKS